MLRYATGRGGSRSHLNPTRSLFMQQLTMKRKPSAHGDAAPSPHQHHKPQAGAPTAAAPANLSEGSRLTAAHARITSLVPPPEAQGTSRQQALGRIGGTCAGFLGSNKFVVEVATDGRSRCQLRSCKIPLRVGELRLGKKPPSLRHGTAKKTKWYHPACAMVAFARCSKRSRVVKTVEDIDFGFDALSEADQKRIRAVVDEGAARAPRATPRPRAAKPVASRTRHKPLPKRLLRPSGRAHGRSRTTPEAG